jgi:hypothetical protein
VRCFGALNTVELPCDKISVHIVPLTAGCCVGHPFRVLRKEQDVKTCNAHGDVTDTEMQEHKNTQHMQLDATVAISNTTQHSGAHLSICAH